MAIDKFFNQGTKYHFDEKEKTRIKRRRKKPKGKQGIAREKYLLTLTRRIANNSKYGACTEELEEE